MYSVSFEASRKSMERFSHYLWLLRPSFSCSIHYKRKKKKLQVHWDYRSGSLDTIPLNRLQIRFLNPFPHPGTIKIIEVIYCMRYRGSANGIIFGLLVISNASTHQVILEVLIECINYLYASRENFVSNVSPQNWEFSVFFQLEYSFIFVLQIPHQWK